MENKQLYVDWVKRVQKIQWANGITPETATPDSTKKKSGPKPGYHHPDVEEWPGPFTPRTDFPHLARPALWINCAYCQGLFPRSVAEAKPRQRQGSRRHHRGTNLVCSIACGSYLRAKPIFRVCAYCSKTFRIYQNNYNKRTCCSDCAASATGGSNRATMSMPLIAYAFEHGIAADRMSLSCDICGVGQKIVGKSTHIDSKHYWVRVGEVDGKLVARCGTCTDKQRAARKKAEAALTPGDKVRLEEAQQLIEGWLVAT